MPREPILVHRVERRAQRVARGLPVTRANELDEHVVERQRLLAAIVELGDDLGLLVGQPRERVQNELETDVPSRAHDDTLKREVAVSERDRIGELLVLLGRDRPHRRDVVVGVALGGEGNAFGHEDATDLEKRREEIDECWFRPIE